MKRVDNQDDAEYLEPIKTNVHDDDSTSQLLPREGGNVQSKLTLILLVTTIVVFNMFH